MNSYENVSSKTVGPLMQSSGDFQECGIQKL
nr:MAG TPA: hypothetical protein [Caudoviricetes sp.]